VIILWSGDECGDKKHYKHLDAT